MPEAVDRDAIVRSSDVANGSARLQGRRVRVMDVVKRYELLDETPEEVAQAFDVTVSDVYAALSYYEDHRGEVRREIQEEQEFVRAMRDD